MIKLPPNAKVNKFIAKTQFFNRLSLSSKIKQDFADKINRITWLYKLSENTIGISKTEEIEEIQIFEIDLKDKTIPKDILKIVDRSIPYPILYVLKFENQCMYAICSKIENPDNYYFSKWGERIDFDFAGIDMTRVYQKIIKKFISTVDLENHSFDAIIEKDEKIKMLQKDMTGLENKIRSEKQFNKKVNLNKIYLAKKKELNSLIKKG